MKPCQGFHKEFLHKERSAPVDGGLDAHGRHAVVDAYAHARSHETSFCVTLSAICQLSIGKCHSLPTSPKLAKR